MAKYDKIYIYFDTNSLEDYIQRITTQKGNDKYFLYLSNFRFPSYYYEIENFIKDNALQDKVSIFIPEIVWMELKKHIIEQYKQDSRNIIDYVKEYKNIFSDLIDIDYRFRENNYSQYLSDLMSDFLENPKLLAKIIKCPKDDACISKIIQNAMDTTPPFCKAYKSQKEYSDAGFKDALITETIFSNRKENILSIFVSKDKDFKDVFKTIENIVICDDEQPSNRTKKIKELLSEQFSIQEEVIKKEISQNSYMLEELIAQTGLDIKNGYKFENFKSLKEQIDKEDTNTSLNVWDVVFKMSVNEQLYTFQITYDGNAHGLENGEIIYD